MRKLVLFCGIAVLLVIGLILGIVWAKQRSHTIAAGNKTQQQVAVDKPAPKVEQPTSQQNPPQTAPQPSSPSPQSSHQPSSVPATGARGIVVALIGYVALILSAAWYIQTRRRLFSIR